MLHWLSQLCRLPLKLVRLPYFFYGTGFTVLFLVLLVLLLTTPGDFIHQSIKKHEYYYIIFVSGTYVLTALSAGFFYFRRLYITRNRLANIPREWIPIGKGDVAKRVRRMIVDGFARSARIAYEGHPRDLAKDTLPSRDGRKSGSDSKDSAGSRPATRGEIVAAKPAWGEISHLGWSAPSSPDLPNVHFEPVILELPHLIEAKAVSLAPTDPLYEPPTNADPQNPELPLPDAQAVELLQRPATMGLRDYLSHLTSIGMINPPTLGETFLDLYERARFSPQPLTEPDFRKLMDIFASILRGMKELDMTVLADLNEDAYSKPSSSSSTRSQPASDDPGAEADTDSISTTGTIEHTPFQTPFHTPIPPRGFFSSSYHTPGLSREASEGGSLAGSERSDGSGGTVRTAPSRATKRTKSKHSTRSREARLAASASRHSLRRVQTASSASTSSRRSGGSVIRLAEARGPLDLPYMIEGEGPDVDGEEF